MSAVSRGPSAREPRVPVRRAAASFGAGAAPRGGAHRRATPPPAHRPATPPPAHRPRRRGRVAAVALVVALGAVGVGVAAWLSFGGDPPKEGYDADAQAGQAPWKSQEEMREELDRVVKEGMFDISIAATIEFPSPRGAGRALIENVAANRYDMRVSIALDDGGEEVYRSGLIAPGSYIESIRLTGGLGPGPHDATATFEAVDKDKHETVGKAAANVQLVVKGG